MSKQLFIAGGSVRAAAQSAVRAGFAVTAADVFCDRDLVDCCQAFQVSDFPQGIASVAQQIPPMAWLYTGGLENEPQLVDQVSDRHTLLGQPGSVLQQVRDPWQVRAALARAHLPCPRLEQELPRHRKGIWLAKPLSGCGGTRIRSCPPGPGPGSRGGTDSPEVTEPGGTYYQPWIRGPSYSAVYLAEADRAVLLGVTRQLVGCAWAGARGFRYVGSIGPVDLDGQVVQTLQRIGDCLTAAFCLRGLFGVDTIVAGADVWTIEVNPRYTASVEILERATGLRALQLHWEACHDGRLRCTPAPVADRLHGKAVVYATQDFQVGPAFYRHLDAVRTACEDCAWADLPQMETHLRAGHPILTALAQGGDVREVHRRLRRLAHAVHARCGT